MVTGAEELPEGRHRAYPGGPAWQCGVIREDVVMGTLHVQLGRIMSTAMHGERVEHVVRIDTNGAVVETGGDPLTRPDPEPYLKIPIVLAAGLLDALSRHFGGSGDTRQLRKDYDAERARVDRLIEHLISPPQVVTEVRGVGR